MSKATGKINKENGMVVVYPPSPEKKTKNKKPRKIVRVAEQDQDDQFIDMSSSSKDNTSVEISNGVVIVKNKKED